MVKTLNMARVNETQRVILLICLYVLVTTVGVIYRKNILETDMAMLFLLLNIVSASLLRPRNAYLMTIMGVIVYYYFLLPDYSSFRFKNAQHVITFSVMVFSGMFAINITQSQRKQIQKNKHLQMRHKTYYQLACHLSALRTSEQIAQATVQFLNKELSLPSAILSAHPHWHLLAKNDSFPYAQLEEFDGRHVPAATTIHWLKDRETVLGVLAVEKDQQDKVTPWVISLLSLSLARSQANQALAEVETANQLETMRSTLLASVSHDLKTPLGTIIGVATTLTDTGLKLDQEVQDELLKSIAEQGERLNRSLTKLLDITRYTSAALVPKLDWVEPEEVLGSALSRLSRRLRHHHVNLKSEPMLVELDSLLIEQVISNLIENSAKYTPKGSEIEIQIEYRDEAFILTVADNGPGIPEQELTRIFERFYRLNHTQVDGTGLGLAICQVIVTAHHGTIVARNRESQGVSFTVAIPCRLYDLKGLYEQ